MEEICPKSEGYEWIRCTFDRLHKPKSKEAKGVGVKGSEGAEGAEGVEGAEEKYQYYPDEKARDTMRWWTSLTQVSGIPLLEIRTETFPDVPIFLFYDAEQGSWGVSVAHSDLDEQRFDKPNPALYAILNDQYQILQKRRQAQRAATYQEIMKGLRDKGIPLSENKQIPSATWAWCRRGWRGSDDSLSDVKQIEENRCPTDSLQPYNAAQQATLNALCGHVGIADLDPVNFRKSSPGFLNSGGQSYTVERLVDEAGVEDSYIQRAVDHQGIDQNKWRSVRRIPTRRLLGVDPIVIDDLLATYPQLQPLLDDIPPCLVRK